MGSSSRTFAGPGVLRKSVHGLGGMYAPVFVELAVNSLHEVATRRGDLRASRRAGNLNRKTFRRTRVAGKALRRRGSRVELWRRQPRTSTACVRLPRGVRIPALRTRRSLAEVDGKVPTLSRKSVPRSARSKAADFWLMATVKAPARAAAFGSRRPLGLAAQLTLTKVRSAARAEMWDGARRRAPCRFRFRRGASRGAGGRGELHPLGRGRASSAGLSRWISSNFPSLRILPRGRLFFGELFLRDSISLEGQSVCTAIAPCAADGLKQPPQRLPGEGIAAAGSRD